MKNRVLSIVYTSANNALVCGSLQYCFALNKAGFQAEVIDLHYPEKIQRLTDLMRSGEVAFAFGLQGIGSYLENGDRQNLWTATKTPFVSVHYDHPAYNPQNHENPSPYVSNLYMFNSFLDTKCRYLPSQQLSSSIPVSLFVESPKCKRRYDERPIKYLYLKTGGSLDETNNHINQMPPKIGDAVRSQLLRMGQNPNLLIADLVNEIFVHFGLDRTEHKEQFWGIMQIMDIHIRRQRAIDFVNWLKFQEGAVITGDGWDFIDKTGAKAIFKPPVNALDAVNLYPCTQYICNTNPYGPDFIHERAVMGLIGGCGIISDSNAWWDQSFASEPAVSLFSWGKPIEDQLGPVMRRTDTESIEAIRSGRDAAYRVFAPKGAAPLLSFAQSTRQFGDQATST